MARTIGWDPNLPYGRVLSIIRMAKPLFCQNIVYDQFPVIGLLFPKSHKQRIAEWMSVLCIYSYLPT